MESSFTEIVSSLSIAEITWLVATVGLLIYFALSKHKHFLMFSLVLSSALVGSTIPILGGIAPLIRWMVIFLFLIIGLIGGKLAITPGFLFFWGYVILGFFSLFRAISFNYQIQRSVLLLVVAFIIPFMYCNKTYPYIRSSLQAIAIAASVFGILNFFLLPGGINNVGRFSGVSAGAASFAAFLGGMIPFSLWGIWRAKDAVRILCAIGFLAGAVTLIFTGQRTGTFTGLIGIIPLFLFMQNRKTFGWSLLLVIGLVGISILLFQQSDVERNSFLLSRYSSLTNFSGRNAIWKMALAAIKENPIMGRGIGASEMFFSSSFHNTYLEIWYNTGFLGLLMFITAQIIFLVRAVILLLTQKDAEIRSIAALATGYMVGFIGLSLFESTGASASSINLFLYLFVSFVVSSPQALKKTNTEAYVDHTGLKPVPECTQ
jgi:O-antigen ligase